MSLDAIVKQLASSDRLTRNEALESLRKLLPVREKFEELELLKLWKGLFYCMWMADKRRAQQALADELAGLVDMMHKQTVLPFFDAFWKTIAREYPGIDRLRLDKFLLLIRRYLNRSFQFLSRDKWKHVGTISTYLEILQETPLNIDNNRIPNGLRFHVIDIYVEELDKVDESREGHLPLDTLLEPLKKLGKGSRTKQVRERVKEALEDERLNDWNGEANGTDASRGGDEGSENDEWGGIEE